jgi:serine/threonine protein kinase
MKIADFGMSRYSGKSSVMVSYVGTPFYMAPQILKNGSYSYKCDIWSLGVVFYELVVGCVPWKVG